MHCRRKIHLLCEHLLRGTLLLKKDATSFHHVASPFQQRIRPGSTIREFSTAPRPSHQETQLETLTSTESSSGLLLPEPEFDFEYLCDPQNKELIRQNVLNRKGVGNIDEVVKLWKEWKEKGATSQNQKDVFTLRRRLDEEARNIPNQTHPDVPIGDESANRLIEVVGDKREFTFKPQTCVDLGLNLHTLRLRKLGHTAGSRSYYLIGGFAKLEQALIRYTVDQLVNQGFELISVPDLVHPTIVEGCGFTTTGKRSQVYKLAKRHGDVCLAATGEIPIAGYYMNSRLREKDLPHKICTVSRCYRAEAHKSIGDGIYRVHQFTKVEMFVLTAHHSEKILRDLINIQRNLFANLGLHFRMLDMASHELGAPAYRKYDLEAWIPTPDQGFWGEISSASNCTDFQSRRLNMKYQDSTGNEHHLHTLNGTACAVPRTIIALVENNQNEDGSISIPSALQPYMGNLEKIVAPGGLKRAKYMRNLSEKKDTKKPPLLRV